MDQSAKSLLGKFNIEFINEYESTPISKNQQISLDADAKPIFVDEKYSDELYEKVSNAAWQYTIKRKISELVILRRDFADSTEIDMLLGKPKTSKTLLEKLSSGARDRIYYEPTLVVIKQGLAQKIEYKITNEILQIKTTLEATLHELNTYGTFESLKVKLKKNLENDQEIHDIIFDYIKSVEYLKYLKAKNLVVSENWQKLKSSQQMTMQLLKDVLDDTTIMGCIETRTIENWNQARVDQSMIRIGMDRDELNQKLNQMIKNYKNENDISADVEEYLEFKITELDQMIEKWMDKCDNEIEAMDDEIQVVGENVKLLKVHTQVAMDKYNERQKEMDDFWEKKRLAAEAILLLQKKFKYAIQIQAWWRGTMVRKHLGPYRSRKRKGRGKKGTGVTNKRGKGKWRNKTR